MGEYLHRHDRRGRHDRRVDQHDHLHDHHGRDRHDHLRDHLHDHHDDPLSHDRRGHPKRYKMKEKQNM